MLTVAKDEATLIEAAAARLTALIVGAIDRTGSAMISLTGGRTPRALYASLANPALPWRERIDWSRVHLFWGDERNVPPNDPESNYGMARDALIQHVPIPEDHVHRMRGELDAREAARLYDQELSDVFAASQRDRRFDVMLLGLGDNAHIASIFPNSPLLAQGADAATAAAPEQSTVGVWIPDLNAWRITLTPAAILGSSTIVMYVAGPNKADAVYAAIEQEPADVQQFPVQLLRPAGDRLEWFMDAPAAGRLRGAPPS